jgi:FkbM family methyltransferase
MDKYLKHTTSENFIYYLDLNNGIDVTIKKSGTYEPHIRNIINKFVNKNSICLDVGANMGVHSVRMGKLGKKVICIEPSKIHERLEENLKINNINYELHVCCVGKEDKKLENVFFENEFKIKPSSDTPKRYDIHCYKIDTLINEKIDFIKIDVDGMEYEVLLGASDKIKKEKPFIITELTLYKYNGSGTEQNVEFMKNRWEKTINLVLNLGYTITFVAYENLSSLKPRTAKEFRNFYDVLLSKQYSSTDVLFIPL